MFSNRLRPDLSYSKSFLSFYKVKSDLFGAFLNYYSLLLNYYGVNLHFYGVKPNFCGVKFNRSEEISCGAA